MLPRALHIQAKSAFICSGTNWGGGAMKIQMPPFLVPVGIKHNPIGKRTLVLCIADCHYGAEWTVRGLRGETLNRYSPEVFCERMADLLQQIRTILEKEQIGDVQLLLCGDTLIVKKIQDYFIRNPEIMREIQCDGHRPVQLSRNKGVCTLKNGSKIESYSVGTMRGNRAKIMVIDESPEVKADDLDAVIGPVRNTKRDICHQRGIADYPSKTISITSACLKSNYFYSMFVSALRDFAKGSTGSFACALDYRSAARVGITDMEFFRKEQRKMPEAKFAMEYGSIFVGAESGSMFPYDLTEGCRTLRQVEYAQPSGSSSDYVIGVDLATSTDRKADNAVICVIKLADMENGAYLKKLVYLRSYHGKRLDALAEEVRRTFSRFPRTTRIVFDHRGLGDAFPQFLAQPWIDPESGKEYPPWTLDDERTIIHNAVPILRSVKASAQINQQLVSCLRVA